MTFKDYTGNVGSVGLSPCGERPAKPPLPSCRRRGAAAIIGVVMPSRPLVECGVAAHDRYGRASNPGGPEARGLSRGSRPAAYMRTSHRKVRNSVRAGPPNRTRTEAHGRLASACYRHLRSSRRLYSLADNCSWATDACRLSARDRLHGRSVGDCTAAFAMVRAIAVRSCHFTPRPLRKGLPTRSTGSTT